MIKKQHKFCTSNLKFLEEKRRGGEREISILVAILLWVVSFDIRLNQRGMREGTLSIVNIRIRVVVEQNNRFVLRNDADGCYKFLELVL